MPETEVQAFMADNMKNIVKGVMGLDAERASSYRKIDEERIKGRMRKADGGFEKASTAARQHLSRLLTETRYRMWAEEMRQRSLAHQDNSSVAYMDRRSMGSPLHSDPEDMD